MGRRHLVPRRFRTPGGARVRKADIEELEKRYEGSSYPFPKYLLFLRYVFDLHRFGLTLYDAHTTNSKYVTVRQGDKKPYKIRWSDHKPRPDRELAGNCDFFVGHTNTRITTTRQAYYAMLEHFKKG